MMVIPLGALAALSLALTLWQWVETRRFPLHRRIAEPGFAPPLTLLKPLSGCDAETEACLRSWLTQDYPRDVQILFGVRSDDDPAAGVVRKLEAEFPRADIRLVVCPRRLGANAKVSTLAQLEGHAAHAIWVVSDADVHAPPDLLRNLVAPLKDAGVGLVNSLYALGPPPAMRWEAVSVNADFWGGVLQSRRLGPVRFALGAALVVRRLHVQKAGGFAALANMLADDFELGRRVAEQNARIALCPVVVTCREAPRGWTAVWRHQLRWVRTIRVCRPWPYAASVLGNATVWPLLWTLADPRPIVWTGAAACLAVRMATAWDSQRRLTLSDAHGWWLWLVPLKDLLQSVLWALAFLGETVEWRGERFRVLRTGELRPATQGAPGVSESAVPPLARHSPPKRALNRQTKKQRRTQETTSSGRR